MAAGDVSHLPASRYNDAVTFVQTQYRALTGADLAAGEQTPLDL